MGQDRYLSMEFVNFCRSKATGAKRMVMHVGAIEVGFLGRSSLMEGAKTPASDVTVASVQPRFYKCGTPLMLTCHRSKRILPQQTRPE